MSTPVLPPFLILDCLTMVVSPTGTGGGSFSGGVGTVFGVVVGVVIFTLINYGLSYIGVNPYWQYIIKGSIIVLAVAIDSLKHAKKK